MNLIEYKAYFAHGDEKEFKASGLISAVAKAMEDRGHLSDQLPKKIVDKDHNKTYTNFKITWD